MSLEPFSVVLPVRDGAASIGQAISDLTVAMSPTDELLVVDDGSQDATARILADWSRREDRLRVITTPGRGLVYALNLGIREASHQWIARADADDRYPADRFSLQRAALKEEVALVTGDYRVRTATGDSTYLPCALGAPFVALSLINPQRIPHPGVVIRREAVWAAGGYVPEDFPAEDLGLWLRMSALGEFVGVPGSVVDWAHTSGSISQTRQVDQHKRTRELLRPFHPALLEDLSDQLIEWELRKYEHAPYGRERALLLLRDLYSWGRHGDPTRGSAIVVRYLMRRPVSSASAAWGLQRDVRHRHRSRRRTSG